MNTKEYILNQYKMYPKLELQDILKFIYQSSYGCEHMVTDYAEVKKRIQDETINCSSSIEELDGDYVRLPLSYGLSASTLTSLFILSAKPSLNAKEKLEEKINILIHLISNKELPFSLEESKVILLKWKKDGYPAVHHSDAFNQLYHPSYRLIHKKFVPFLELFKYIDNNHPSILSIDGRCASGKTTLAQFLSEIYDCNVFSMDDFFLQPHQRTKERFNIPGGNVDHERFKEEVLIPLSKHQDVEFSKFDCSTMSLQPSILIPYKPLNIIEGSYSMHPNLQKYYDYSIFLTADKEEQLFRLEKRNPKMLNTFIQRWIPLEEAYFNAFSIDKKCNLQINTSKA
ncbi:hypothetical protein [uncultured Holdemanella sp.]|uniref:uridine kinase family protein n=1 Tax=uncultured Holdemanella sp. TaxID=1763549 RepID=UPI002805D9BA|nr:hypothetical protein [uncultured Holdemanella sp.]